MANHNRKYVRKQDEMLCRRPLSVSLCCRNMQYALAIRSFASRNLSRPECIFHWLLENRACDWWWCDQRFNYALMIPIGLLQTALVCCKLCLNQVSWSNLVQNLLFLCFELVMHMKCHLWQDWTDGVDCKAYVKPETTASGFNSLNNEKTSFAQLIGLTLGMQSWFR
jgi:hypothetical protein